jgi:putative ribosome biogenesis GTPase RsgA
MVVKYVVGDWVEKTDGDYTYRGEVVAVFRKRSGLIRYVVENTDGLLFIFNGGQLRPYDPPEVS